MNPSKGPGPGASNSKAKVITFYKNDTNFSGLRLAVTKRRYPSFDALLQELTNKVSLPFGARNVYTPGGVHDVKDLTDLEDGGSYVVGTDKKKKPLNLEKVQKPKVWKSTSKQLTKQDSKAAAASFSYQNGSVKSNGTTSKSPPQVNGTPLGAGAEPVMLHQRVPNTPKKVRAVLQIVIN